MVEFKGVQYNVTDRKVSIEEISELVGKPVWVEYVKGEWPLIWTDDIELIVEADGEDNFEYTTKDKHGMFLGNLVEDMMKGMVVLYHVEEVE